MQNNEKTTQQKTAKQLIAEVKNQEIAKIILELNEFDDIGIRNFQQSVNYCIYAIAVMNQEDFLIEDEVKNHIGMMHVLADNLYKIENIIHGKKCIAMNRGHYIHMARLKEENKNLKGHSVIIPQVNHETSLLKLRIHTLEEDIRQKQDEINKLQQQVKSQGKL